MTGWDEFALAMWGILVLTALWAIVMALDKIEGHLRRIANRDS